MKFECSDYIFFQWVRVYYLVFEKMSSESRILWLHCCGAAWKCVESSLILVSKGPPSQKILNYGLIGVKSPITRILIYPYLSLSVRYPGFPKFEPYFSQLLHYLFCGVVGNTKIRCEKMKEREWGLRGRGTRILRSSFIEISSRREKKRYVISWQKIERGKNKLKFEIKNYSAVAIISVELRESIHFYHLVLTAIDF